MSTDPDLDRTLTVTQGDVTVEKAFDPDEFPVPAITFRIRSDRAEPTRVRLVDRIPEEFPMSTVGFHPEYDSDNWTAYKDHRVEYERVLDPGEEVRTVYGVRLDREEDAAAFLQEPTIEEVGADDPGGVDEVEEILGEDRNQPVRDVLAGDRDSLPGLDEEDLPEPGAEPDLDLDEPAPADGASGSDAGATGAESDADGAADDASGPAAAEGDAGAEPRETGGDRRPAVTPGSEPPPEPAVGGGDADPADDEAAGGAGDPATADEPGDGTAAAEPAVAEGPSGTAADGSAAAGQPAGDGVAAALAAELREGSVPAEDLEVLREELDAGVPRSVEVRIDRLQSSVGDLEAYADALREFIDEEGTAEEFVAGIRDEVDRLSGDVADLEAELDAAERERSAIDDRVDGTEAAVSDLEERLDDAVARADSLGSDLSALEEELSEVRGSVEDVEGDVGELAERVDATEADLREELAAEVEDLRDELAEVREGTREEAEELREQLSDLEDEIEEVEQFREQLGQAFGGAVGGDGE